MTAEDRVELVGGPRDGEPRTVPAGVDEVEVDHYAGSGSGVMCTVELYRRTDRFVRGQLRRVRVFEWVPRR